MSASRIFSGKLFKMYAINRKEKEKVKLRSEAYGLPGL
jgi:hypothetical protein